MGKDTKYKLSITIPFEEEMSEEECIRWSKYLLKEICDSWDGVNSKIIKASLLRKDDRSGANLLLPKNKGRFGQHYQNRKGTILEILKENTLPTSTSEDD